MKYAFMQEHREAYKVRSMCDVLKVSRSGYYAWRDRLPSARQRGSAELLQQIRHIHTQSRSLYGSPRITAELNEQGHRCGKNRVASYEAPFDTSRGEEKEIQENDRFTT
jgi:hypothetical protein